MSFRDRFTLLTLCCAAAAMALPLPAPGQDSPQPPTESSFHPAAPQGFNDRHNSQSWSLQWFNGSLFLGTGRSTACVQAATLALFRPDLGSYPPREADVECTEDPLDLPLQAQIWKYTPQLANAWEMVYEAPNDVPIQGTDKFTARDIGYRGMAVVPEPGPNGTEIPTLYVSGVTSRGAQGVGFAGPVPPPRILRSRDGVTFEPIPQDPGTFMGDITVTGFRGIKLYNGKFYVVASLGLLGHGILLESERPWEGNDSFRVVSPPGVTFFEIEIYNGHLYAGTGVQPALDDTPFSLLRTDASGTPPYQFEVVIPDGAYKNFGASAAVISLHVFGDRLYVGTDRELLRVNPDDTWELLAGNPRLTPVGWLAPLSGLNIGFDNLLNIHMWRMATASGWLLIGTQDQSAKWRNSLLGPILAPRMGFDLYATRDGWYYTLVSRTGFGDLFNSGVRNMTVTPLGFFLGTANHYFGLRLFHSSLDFHDALMPSPAPLPPRRLEVERTASGNVLTWEGADDAALLRVFRDTGFSAPIEIDLINAANDLYLDATAEEFKGYHYYLVAEDSAGQPSGPSNIVRTPSFAAVPTFNLLRAWIDGSFAERAVRVGTHSYARRSTAAAPAAAAGSGAAPAVAGVAAADEMVEIDGLTLTSAVDWRVHHWARLGAGFSVQAPGHLALTAGSGIILDNGVEFGQGVQVELILDPPDITKLQSLAEGLLLQAVDEATLQFSSGDVATAKASLAILRANLLHWGEAGVLPPWRAQDLEIVAGKLMRRIILHELGFLSAADVLV